MPEKLSLLIKLPYNHLRLMSQHAISVLPVNFKFCVHVAYNAEDAGPSKHSGPPSPETSLCLDHPHLKHYNVWTTLT